MMKIVNVVLIGFVCLLWSCGQDVYMDNELEIALDANVGVSKQITFEELLGNSTDPKKSYPISPAYKKILLSIGDALLQSNPILKEMACDLRDKGVKIYFVVDPDLELDSYDGDAYVKPGETIIYIKNWSCVYYEEMICHELLHIYMDKMSNVIISKPDRMKNIEFDVAATIDIMTCLKWFPNLSEAFSRFEGLKGNLAYKELIGPIVTSKGNSLLNVSHEQVRQQLNDFTKQWNKYTDKSSINNYDYPLFFRAVNILRFLNIEFGQI